VDQPAPTSSSNEEAKVQLDRHPWNSGTNEKSIMFILILSMYENSNFNNLIFIQKILFINLLFFLLIDWN